jgi:hypothetical protein
LQVALLADEDDVCLARVPETPPDIVCESGTMFPRMNQYPPPFQPSSIFSVCVRAQIVPTILLQVRCGARSG